MIKEKLARLKTTLVIGLKALPGAAFSDFGQVEERRSYTVPSVDNFGGRQTRFHPR